VRLPFALDRQGEEMKKLIAILLLAFASGCLPSYRRSCNELETDMSVSLDEFYSHCRAHSRTD
jgi:hypothetical protein